ncbi:uncharacterized protein LOC144102553 [Amblyomma americanum]
MTEVERSLLQSGSEMSQLVSGYGERRTEEEDSYPDEALPLICCCIVILFVIMIILLLLLSGYYSGEHGDETQTAKATYRVPAPGGGPPPAAETQTTSGVTSRGPQQSITPGTSTPAVVPSESTTLSSSGPATFSPGDLSNSTTSTSAHTTMAPPTPSSTKASTGRPHDYQDDDHDQYNHEYHHDYDQYNNEYHHDNDNDNQHNDQHDDDYPTAPTPGKPNRNFTLICVFEYIKRQRYIWPKTHQCTDYVYIRAFTYFDDKKINHEPLEYTTKTKKVGGIDQYLDDNPLYWENVMDADSSVRQVTTRGWYKHADWYIGMWGCTYLRLLASFWEPLKIRDSLNAFVRQPYLGSLNTSVFEGFAIINTIIRDTRAEHQAGLTYNARK